MQNKRAISLVFLSVRCVAERTPHLLASGIFGFQRGVEEGAGFQHGADDGEQAICNGSQGAAMAVTPAAQVIVFCPAFRIALNGGEGPMVHGGSEPVIAGLPADDDAALAGPLGDGRELRSNCARRRNRAAARHPMPLRAAWRGRSFPLLARMRGFPRHAASPAPAQPPPACGPAGRSAHRAGSGLV